MSKRVVSPVKKFSGTVVLKDPLSYPFVLKYEDAVRTVKAAENPEVGVMYAPFIPLFIEAVEKWELANFPENPTASEFPGTPRGAVFALVAWLIGEITEIYRGSEDSDPKA